MNKLQTQKHFGLRWQDYDERDRQFSPSQIAIPVKTDLRAVPKYPDCYDQTTLGSCVANGVGFTIEFDQIKQGKAFYTPSRLAIYYNGRVIEGTVNQDSGLQVRDGIKAVAKLGVCPETEWPYVVSKFKTKPPAKCFKDALKEKAVTYMSIDNTSPDAIKSALATGLPVVFGATLYSSFEGAAVAKTGIVNMPAKHEAVIGGHCIVIVGHDDVKRQYIVRNSWGTAWGEKGHCYFPYDYIHNSNLVSDCWVVQTVS